MKTMIFAAGLGTRLKPITDSIPKALVPIGGKPLVSIIIDRLKSFGINEFVINVHHFAPKIKSYLEENDNFGALISISDESDVLLDTGGGIKRARPFLEGDGWFLTHNVDILSNIDIGAFEKCTRPDAFAVLAVSKRDSSRYLLFDDDMRLSGWMNTKTGEIRTHIPDFNPDNYRRLAYSGIQLVNDRIFRVMENEPDCFPIIDFYIRNAGNFPIYGQEIPELKLLDVGKVSSLEEAERMCLLLKNP